MASRGGVSLAAADAGGPAGRSGATLLSSHDVAVTVNGASGGSLGSVLAPGAEEASAPLLSQPLLQLSGPFRVASVLNLHAIELSSPPPSTNSQPAAPLFQPAQHAAAQAEDARGAASRPVVRFLCFNITALPRGMQLAVLSLGVFAFFVLSGFVEEYTFNRLEGFRFGWYLTFFELVCFMLFAVLERKFVHSEAVFAHRADLKRHALVAVAMTTSRGLTNVSLQYLSYPTQVVCKSLKLLTVMAGSVCVLSKSFTMLEYLSALLLVSSSILFSLGDVDATQKTETIGLVIVGVSLFADALHSTKQEELMRSYRASIGETMFYTNLFSSLITLVFISFNGELLPALRFCSENPIAYALFVVRALVIFFGVLCFLSITHAFDVVLATTATTVRKILTVLLSFIVFPKPWTLKYALGLLLFSGGLSLGIYDNQLRRKKVAAS
jgi:adenosine 3'-phospho 5'-phosphosulfate transporter B3